MKRVIVASTSFLLLAALPATAFAQDRNQKRLERQLQRLDPATRLEQVCDAEAMRRIARDHREFRIDRSVGSALAEPRVKEHTITGQGAAFRSKGKWYQYSFTCQATPDRLRVIAFDYKLGDEIPEAQWSQYGLYE
jgi:hypothetical protein